MRRKEREVTDFDEIIEILDSCHIAHLALISEGKPYAVQVNFGFDVIEKNVTLYFHGASDGEKICAIKQNPFISFCAESFFETGHGNDKNIACTWTEFYKSIIGFGKAEIILDEEEKKHALTRIMIHNGYSIPKEKNLKGIEYPTFNSIALAKTTVVKITIETLTAKKHVKN